MVQDSLLSLSQLIVDVTVTTSTQYLRQHPDERLLESLGGPPSQITLNWSHNTQQIHFE